MILFKRISYKNFLSTGNQPIEIALDMSQTTLIVGTNGSGKSTLLDALCFVLLINHLELLRKNKWSTLLIMVIVLLKLSLM